MSGVVRVKTGRRIRRDCTRRIRHSGGDHCSGHTPGDGLDDHFRQRRTHSGVDDPHHRGEAYDLRSHDLTVEEKAAVVANVMATLGWERFYGFLEAPGSGRGAYSCAGRKGHHISLTGGVEAMTDTGATRQ